MHRAWRTGLGHRETPSVAPGGPPANRRVASRELGAGVILGGIPRAIRYESMVAKRTDLGELAARLRPVLERHGFQKAIVFGSVARGTASRRSDLDLILVKRTTQRFLDRYGGILRDLYDAAPEREIEALIYTPEELERLSGRRFIATALREGEVIFEST